MRLSPPLVGDRLSSLALDRNGINTAKSPGFGFGSGTANTGGIPVPSISCSDDLKLMLPGIALLPSGAASRM
jgi:hypothetical protein